MAPDRLDAGGRSVGSRLGCPPEGGGYVVPGLSIPVGYCRQNNRCRRSSPKASAQPHRRHRVAPSKVRENPNSSEINLLPKLARIPTLSPVVPDNAPPAAPSATGPPRPTG